ncbi:hypothetical protein DRJ25_03820 [Candidatus Woesearchaeota archaeon]|nr:MAG: hypothetical protein DRJ25_03820 [Candidatus Woesearchaeota archaeon]
MWIGTDNGLVNMDKVNRVVATYVSEVNTETKDLEEKPTIIFLCPVETEFSAARIVFNSAEARDKYMLELADVLGVQS